MSKIQITDLIEFNQIPAQLTSINEDGQLVATLQRGELYCMSANEIRVMRKIDQATYDELAVQARLMNLDADYDMYHVSWKKYPGEQY